MSGYTNTGKEPYVPCPFCGKEPEYQREGVLHRLKCTYRYCHIQPKTAWKRSHKEARDRWSIRLMQQRGF